MPDSQATANSFAASDRGSNSDQSASVDLCHLAEAGPLLGHCQQGCVSPVLAEVDYDPQPNRKNPRSIAGENPEYDSQGKSK